MADIWDYEHFISRNSARLSGRGWTRRAVFEGIPVDQAELLIPAEYTPFPGSTGKHAEVLMVASSDPNRRRPTCAVVTLDYRPLIWDEWLEANPNHAVLLSQTGAYGERIRALPGTAAGFDDSFWTPTLDMYGVKDVNTPNFLGITGSASSSSLQVIEGPDPEAGTEWEVTSGTNYVTKYRPIYEVYAVVDDLDSYYYPYVATCGCYNDVPLEGFPLWPELSTEAQWLQVSASMAPRPGSKRLYTCRFQFMLDMERWDRPCISTELRIRNVKEPVYDWETGEIVGERIIAKAVGTGNTRSTQLIHSANFFNIDWMFVDSWMKD